MIIRLHWFEHTYQDISDEQLQQLVDLTGIPRTAFKSYTTKSGTSVYTYTLQGAGGEEAVSVTVPQKGYGRITLRGSFFDAFPNVETFPIYEFLSDLGGNAKRVDYSFEDDTNQLDFEEIRRLSTAGNYQNYLTGLALGNRKRDRKYNLCPDSNNRQGIPDVHANHRLIHYGDAKRNFVKCYHNGSFTKFELTLTDPDQNHILLMLYCPQRIADFNTAAIAALVKHVNFITPASKRAKRYIKLDWWEKFLGSDIKPIRWTEYREEATEKQTENFVDSLQRHVARLQNLLQKHGLNGFYFDLSRIEQQATELWQERQQQTLADYQAEQEIKAIF